ncbi:unnamed protein product, partial [Polarella glacialis]
TGRCWERASRLFQEMPAPDVITFNAMASVWSAAGRWEQASFQLTEMRRRALQPSLVSYNAAVVAAAYPAGGEEGLGGRQPWQRALQLREDMQHGGLPSDVITFGALATACNRGLQWAQAVEQLLEKMPRASLTPNLVSLNTALGACEAGQRWDLALGMLLRLWRGDHGFQPDVCSYNAALAACGAAASGGGGSWRWAVQLLRGARLGAWGPEVRPD